MGYEKPVSQNQNEILDEDEIENMHDFILKNIKNNNKTVFSLK